MALGMPLEGFTLEYFVRPFRDFLLQPVLTAGLLVWSLRQPENASRILSIVAKDKVNFIVCQRILKFLVAAGSVYRMNTLLTRLVLNNWVRDRNWDWKKEVVIVTGGSSGIGECITRKLSEQNIRVVILDIVEPRASLPSNTLFYKLDITCSTAIHEIAERMRKEVGQPTVLVNCAGVGTSKPIMEESEAEIRLAFNVNIIAHFLLVKEFVPYMIKRNHGHVITIASMASFFVHAGNVDYCCTKAGALAFHEGLGQELKSRYGASKVRTT